ncbi:BRO1 domain containing protein [Amanita muscaria]
MAHQSPMISIPKKSTEEVDWTTPIRTLIAQSYGEDPDSYATECASLQRCRQDAVRGAGSDTTARDLLYKYFGQLELLELRFSEIRVNFPWHDAFTNKVITQSSIAYEKASILFQISSTHSAIAASQSRSDPEGIKRAFYYFRTCAGMLTYINENFLHAPSTDLSRDVVKFLVGLILAQATEVFFEKCTEEKKANALVAKIGSQAASMYTSLSDEIKEFQGKGIFDRNWVTLIQIKAKYFSSLAQYYRGQADEAAGKHGEALGRFNLAESLAKEAHRTTTGFNVVASLSPTLPSDAGSAIFERTKAHQVLCTERRNEAQRENDLIYNAVIPPPESLLNIEKTAVATPIHIHDVYATPDVQKTIGQDFFIRLIPLSVHESASVYSEEKAKLVRAEVEKAEGVEGEARSVIDGMGIRVGLSRFKAIAEGEVGGEDEIPLDVRRWKEDIAVIEESEPVEGLMEDLQKFKSDAHRDIDSINQELEVESRGCETMRVKYEHLWTQAPSAGLTKDLRKELKAHASALEAAEASDRQVASLWESVKGEIRLLLGSNLEQLFRERAGSSTGEHLLDLDTANDVEESQERAKIGQFVSEIEERLSTLSKISRERNEVLKDLKEKIQTDDVSHLLLLNKRNTGVEPTLFAAELEKFRPYQQRLAATVHHQEVALQELGSLWKGLKDLAGRGPGARKWDEREKLKKDTVRRFSRVRDVYMEIRDGLAKGLQFYSELFDLTSKLLANTRKFVSARVVDRDALIAKLETEKRYSTAQTQPPPPKPPLPPPPVRAPPSVSPGASAPTFESSFASMSIGTPSSGRQAQPQQPQWSYPPPPKPYNPPSQQPQRSASIPLPPPPVPPSSQYQSANHDPYGSLGMLGSQTFSTPPSTATTTPPTTISQHQRPSSSAFPPPPPLVDQQRHSSRNSGQFFGFPPPPPPPPQPQTQSQQYNQQYATPQYPQQQPYSASPLPLQQQPPPPQAPPAQPGTPSAWQNYYQNYQPQVNYGGYPR